MTEQLREKIGIYVREIIVEAIKHADVGWTFDSHKYADQIDKYYEEAGYVKLADIREKWAYELAAGHPVMALRLEDWVEICEQAGINEDWWELKQVGRK